MAKRYSIFLGGNYRHDGHLDPAWKSDLTPFDDHVEYAAHLKRRHFVLPFHFSHYGDNEQMWYRSNGINDLSTGDELVLNLLGAGTKLNDYVFNNKVAVPGTVVELLFTGSAADSPVDHDGLYEAIEKAKENLSKAQTTLAADQENSDAKEVVKSAKKALKDAEKAVLAAQSSEVAKVEVDLGQQGFHHFEINKFLQTNGLVILRLKEGTMRNTCWSSMLDLVHFNDQHGCACGKDYCDTPYPQAECSPVYSGTKYR